ncbi:MAG: cell division protein ZapE [Pseudomonadota bacterium]
MQGPLFRYEALVASGDIAADEAQRAAAHRLQHLHDDLDKLQKLSRTVFNLFAKRSVRTHHIKGVYLWGGVGRGKSLLMDILHNGAPLAEKRRVHFHAFMAEVHERVNHYRKADEAILRRHPAFDKKSPNDPMPLVAHDVAKSARLFCFDEFQVTDIADAMILGRLFSGMLDLGSVIVATSNRHPDDLYKDGLNRQLFLPTIDLIKDRLDVIELDAERDYRLARLENTKSYFYPMSDATRREMDNAWTTFISGATPKPEVLTVKGREVEIPLAARNAARVTFHDLCAKPLGASDYLAIAEAFSTVFIDGIPQLSPAKRDEAKRFVTLIDALYETRTKLVCSAEAEPDDLYPAGDGSFEFARTASRLIEMRSADYIGAERRQAAK